MGDGDHGRVIVIESKDQFDQHLKSGKPVVVDFWATWCGPCKAIAPDYIKLSKKYADVTFLKVDVDEVPAVAEEAGVAAMPTFIVYVNGAKAADPVVGASLEKLENLIVKFSEGPVAATPA